MKKRNQNTGRKTCHQGHPLSPGNVYVYPDGRRQCRICQAARSFAWHKRRSPRGHPQAMREVWARMTPAERRARALKIWVSRRRNGTDKKTRPEQWRKTSST